MKLATFSSTCWLISGATVVSAFTPRTIPRTYILQGTAPVVPSSLAAWRERGGKRSGGVIEKEEVNLNLETEDDTSIATVTIAPSSSTAVAPAVNKDENVVVVVEGEMTETQKLMKQVKDAGLAGVISYAAWEFGFWAVSVPVVIFGYYAAVGHFPDLSDKEDLAKLGAEAFAFVNFARFAVPLRIGLALSTTPWIQNNIVDKFLSKPMETISEEEPLVTHADGSAEEVDTPADTTADAPVDTPVEVESSQHAVRRWRSFLPFGRRKH